MDTIIKLNISVLELFQFGGPNLITQGQQVFDGGHVLDVGIESRNSEGCNLQGVCLQSSNPKNSPHLIHIETKSEFSKWQFKCSCKAGLGGKCKHIYAILLHIHMYKEIHVWTCTQKAQKWDKIAKQVSEAIHVPQQINTLPEFYNCKSKSYQTTASEDEDNFELLSSDPTSSINVFLTRSCHKNTETQNETYERTHPQEHASSVEHELSETNVYLSMAFSNVTTNFDFQLPPNISIELETFYEKFVIVDYAKAQNICDETIFQNSYLWKNERRKRITASECYSIFTYNNNKNADWDRKVVSYYKPLPNLKNLRLGRFYENDAIEMYEKIKHAKVTKFGFIISPKIPWLGSSPDGFVIETRTLIEVKCVMNSNDDNFSNCLQKLKYLKISNTHNLNKMYNNGFTLNQKHKYYAQIQINMLLLNATNCDLIVYDYKEKRCILVNVEKNIDFINELLSVLYNIYFKYFLPHIYKNFITLKDKENMSDDTNII